MYLAVGFTTQSVYMCHVHDNLFPFCLLVDRFPQKKIVL